MIAVFQSTIPYLQIRGLSVMGEQPVYSEEATYYSESGIPDKHEKAQVGVALEERKGIRESFDFFEGEKHNRLTLSDLEEIEAFRHFIKSREYIREIETD